MIVLHIGWNVFSIFDQKRDRDQRRASDHKVDGTKVCYLVLLDWTGRQLHRTKRGQIPADCAPILECLECSPETWLDFVQNFRLRFRNEAGLASARQAYRNRRTNGQASPQAMRFRRPRHTATHGKVMTSDNRVDGANVSYVIGMAFTFRNLKEDRDFR